MDPWLYLRADDARSGMFLHDNDDVDRQAGNLNSQIIATLAAATYTIEATTYAAGQPGTFTLTISGLPPRRRLGQSANRHQWARMIYWATYRIS